MNFARLVHAVRAAQTQVPCMWRSDARQSYVVLSVPDLLQERWVTASVGCHFLIDFVNSKAVTDNRCSTEGAELQEAAEAAYLLVPVSAPDLGLCLAVICAQNRSHCLTTGLRPLPARRGWACT